MEIQGKTFYNSGAPLMLGVLSDATPASRSAAASVPEKLRGKNRPESPAEQKYPATLLGNQFNS